MDHLCAIRPDTGKGCSICVGSNEQKVAANHSPEHSAGGAGPGVSGGDQLDLNWDLDFGSC